MKKIYTILTAVLLTVTLCLPQQVKAQSPEKMSYQAVVRDASDNLVTSTLVGMQISILQGSADGTPVYIETQTPTTNANGLVSIEIGSTNATVVSGDFSTIDWANSTYFIKTETDPAGGTNYTITGTNQLLSVPYALHAKTAETVTGEITVTETDPTFTAWDKSTGISITESQISDLNHFTNTDETDPVFNVSVASGITATDTANWNKEQGSFTEADPIYSASQAVNITVTDITNLGNLSGTNTGDQTLSGLGGVASNTAITGATKTKVTYDAKGLVTSGVDATTADIAATTDKNYVTDAQLIVIGNTSNTNTGDQDITAMTHTNRVALDAVIGTNTGDQTLATILTGNTSADSNKITELADPTADQDAATKAYVDALEQQIEAMQNSLINAGSIVKDYDGNVYGVVTIGTQKWMTENLKTTHYANGDAIPDGTGAGDISGETDPKYWFAYSDNLDNVYTYGRLYTWHTVTDSRNVCPDGWHAPSDAEWTTLTDYLGGTSVAGGKLKETGTTHWNTPNTGATNETGFTALPGGYRFSNGSFLNLGSNGYWWSATESDATSAWYRYLYYNLSNVSRYYLNKKIGFSIRCLRD